MKLKVNGNARNLVQIVGYNRNYGFLTVANPLTHDQKIYNSKEETLE